VYTINLEKTCRVVFLPYGTQPTQRGVRVLQRQVLAGLDERETIDYPGRISFSTQRLLMANNVRDII
jgi:hypothetical protein